MLKKISSFVIVLAMMSCLIFTSLVKVQAADRNEEQVDGSYLTFDDYSEGKTGSGIVTYGIHMMDGECSITKSGIGKIYVYGSTTANHYVDYLCVIVYVDKYNVEDKTWERIDAWQAEKVDHYYISTSKMLNVERGYYYRVHADHICGNVDEPYDEETTLTDGIYIN